MHKLESQLGLPMISCLMARNFARESVAFVLLICSAALFLRAATIKHHVEALTANLRALKEGPVYV